MGSTKGRTSRWQKMITGPALVLLFWFLFAFMAFVPFNRETPAALILSVAFASFLVIIGLLIWKRLVDLETGGYSFLFILLLIGLYMIPLQDDLTRESVELNEQISRKHEDRYEYARELMWEINDRFTGPTREYLLQPLRIFVIKSSTYYWETQGYVPSHLQAQLYRHMLLASGRFTPEEVEYRTGRCFNSPHGYVAIGHPERTIYADLWAAENFDDYRFGQVVEMPSCDGIAAEASPDMEPYLRPDER
jgi:hypothetical protein